MKEEIVQRGAAVTLVTRFFEPFRELPIVSRIAALRAIDEHDAEILPVHELERIRDGAEQAADDIDIGDFKDWGDPERIAVNVETLYREFDPSRPALPVPQLFVRLAEWS